MTKDDLPPWPVHGTETRPWSQVARAGTRDDRMLDHVDTSIPPLIAELPVPLDAPLAAELETAVREIVVLDNAYGTILEPLAALLLRTESVASSKSGSRRRPPTSPVPPTARGRTRRRRRW
jgi:hypothetical protein